MREILEISLAGKLSPEQLATAFLPLQPQLDSCAQPCPLLVDASAMTDYEMTARASFLDWLSEHRAHISGVAILTDKAVWRMVIRAMSMACSVHMRPFSSRDEAMSWLRE